MQNGHPVAYHSKHFQKPKETTPLMIKSCMHWFKLSNTRDTISWEKKLLCILIIYLCSNFFNPKTKLKKLTYEMGILFATISFGYQVQKGKHKYGGNCLS
jgi:hypothetical protein